MVITVAKLKGGTGTTTTAVYLAAQTGATLIDADPQGSAIRWATRAEAAGEPMGFPVIPGNLNDLADLVDGEAMAARHVVIDCALGNPDLVLAAIELADVVVVPSNAREDDIEQAQKAALQCADLGIPCGILLSRLRPQETAQHAYRRTLAADGYQVFETEVFELVRIGFKFGFRIGDDVHPFDKLLTEIGDMI